VTVLDLRGDIVVGSGGRELSGAVRLLLRGGERKVLLNLAGTRFVDSGGLGHLVTCHNLMRDEGGQLKLMLLTERVWDVFVITRLATVFDVYDEAAAALASYK
jgi:anti-sigma B factor antagonist